MFYRCLPSTTVFWDDLPMKHCFCYHQNACFDMIYPCFYDMPACKVTLTWEWPSTGARVAVPFMIWVRTFSRLLCWLCAQVCPDLHSSQKDPHGFGTRFRTVAQARDYRREHMMPPCDKPDYVEPNDSAHELWTYPWRRRDGQSNDNLQFC